MRKKIDFYKKGTLVFATSCDLNYLSQASALAESVKIFYPNSIFILGLNEVDHDLADEVRAKVRAFDVVKTGIDLHPKFLELSSRYGIIELCCAVKPNLLKMAFNLESKYVVYLDPDCLLYGPLDALVEAFENGYEAALTPHIKVLGNIDMEISSMAHGIFNFGFIALKNTVDSFRFLDWWDARLEKLCIRDHQRGIFTDQSWGALLVGTLNTKIIRDAGYNYATWNLKDHELRRIKGRYVVDKSRLIFAHFSGFKTEGIYKIIKKFGISDHQTYDSMFQEYQILVTKYENLLGKILEQKTVKQHFKRHLDVRNLVKLLKFKLIEYLYKNCPWGLKKLQKIKHFVKST